MWLYFYFFWFIIIWLLLLQCCVVFLSHGCSLVCLIILHKLQKTRFFNLVLAVIQFNFPNFFCIATFFILAFATIMCDGCVAVVYILFLWHVYSSLLILALIYFDVHLTVLCFKSVLLFYFLWLEKWEWILPYHLSYGTL